MKPLSLILTVLLSIAVSFSQTPKNGRAVFEKSDKRLNDAYQMLLAAKRSDAIFKKNLKVSQRIWIQFRNAELKLKYPNSVFIENRDSLPMDQARYLVYLTDDRTEALLEWLKTETDGLVNYLPFDKKTSDDNDSDYIPIEIYISDLKIISLGNVHGGIGLDRPYWTNQLVMCGKNYEKGVVMTPQNGGIIAFVEYQLPKNGRRLAGLAGWAEQEGAVHRGKMRFRFFIDGELLYGRELSDKECQTVDLELSPGKVLRIETDDAGDGYEGDHMAFGGLRIIY